MRLLHAFLLVISATSCMAQSPKIDHLMDKLDCTSINTSPQLDDCVHQHMNKSNVALSNEIANFEKRAKHVYAADPKLGDKLINKVRKAQDSWATFRGLNCSVDAFEVEEGTPAYITTVNNCIIRMNAERIKELKKLPD